MIRAPPVLRLVGVGTLKWGEATVPGQDHSGTCRALPDACLSGWWQQLPSRRQPERTEGVKTRSVPHLVDTKACALRNALCWCGWSIREVGDISL